MKNIPGMRYLAILAMVCCFFLNFMIYREYGASLQAKPEGTVQVARKVEPEAAVPPSRGELRRPAEYRGIYLHNYSARMPKILADYVTKAKQHGVNTLVLDMQDAVYFRPGEIPQQNVALCLSNGIWPVARIVVFPYGLKEYPVPQSLIADRMALARKAVSLGFREIQFDYIRFEDSGRLRQVGQEERYRMVEGFLSNARRELSAKGIVVSADVFGRVALNRHDPIGQRLEGLDNAVDVILPMAYPSHYTWSRFMIANPYYTLYKSSVVARDRLKKAQLVMYIQGFEMRVAPSGLSLPVYIAHQMQACVDARIGGWIVWNAAQNYGPTWDALKLMAAKSPIPGIEAARAATAREERSAESQATGARTPATKKRTEGNRA